MVFPSDRFNYSKALLSPFPMNVIDWTCRVQGCLWIAVQILPKITSCQNQTNTWFLAVAGSVAGFVCPSLCLSVRLYLSVYLSVYISVSAWLYICSSVCLSVCGSFFITLFLSSDLLESYTNNYSDKCALWTFSEQKVKAQGDMGVSKFSRFRTRAPCLYDGFVSIWTQIQSIRWRYVTHHVQELDPVPQTIFR